MSWEKRNESTKRVSILLIWFSLISCGAMISFSVEFFIDENAFITYIGGGLRTMGVHNVLEAAVYRKPVLFGPYYHKYKEAVGLVIAGGGLPFIDEKRNGIMLKELIEALLINEEEYNFRSNAAGDFVQSNKGATQKIIQFIQEKRLLTN